MSIATIEYCIFLDSTVRKHLYTTMYDPYCDPLLAYLEGKSAVFSPPANPSRVATLRALVVARVD